MLFLCYLVGLISCYRCRQSGSSYPRCRCCCCTSLRSIWRIRSSRLSSCCQGSIDLFNFLFAFVPTKNQCWNEKLEEMPLIWNENFRWEHFDRHFFVKLLKTHYFLKKWSVDVINSICSVGCCPSRRRQTRCCRWWLRSKPTIQLQLRHSCEYFEEFAYD